MEEHNKGTLAAEHDLGSEAGEKKTTRTEDGEKNVKVEKKSDFLKQDLDLRVEEKLEELEKAYTAQISLNENLLATTLLVEKAHESFASTVEDLEEGIRARAYELQQAPVQGGTPEAGQDDRCELLDKLNESLARLKESEEKIGAAVGELRKSADERGSRNQVAEDIYKSIFKRVKDGIFITDADWNVTDINPAMCEILGLRYRRLAMGLNIRSRVFADKADFEIFENNVITSGFIRNHEAVFLNKARENIPVIVSCTAIWNEKNVLVGYEGIVHDITEYKRMEEERINMKRLEAVHNMVITINHSMNQNLTVIYNYVQLLRKRCATCSEGVDYLDSIYSEVEKLIELVSKIVRIKDLKTIEYVRGVEMIDLEKSIR